MYFKKELLQFRHMWRCGSSGGEREEKAWAADLSRLIIFWHSLENVVKKF